MSSQSKNLLTLEEYLALERKAELKSEYFAGEMFAMAGASRRHNLITANILRVLGNQLLERACNVYPSDMRVKISKIGKYTYPDVVVACGEERFEDEHNDTLLNPVVIIEVISPSTEREDRGRKKFDYFATPSIRQYALIEQDERLIDLYTRTGDGWIDEIIEGDAVLNLSSIGIEVSLDVIYEDTELAATPRREGERQIPAA